MPRKTVSKRRTRVKARARAKRVSRRRKGGECGDITQYEDNYHCVEAGCDPFKCAEYHKSSKPHKPVVDETTANAEKMKNLEVMKKNARNARNYRRAAWRAASYSPRTSNSIPTSSSHYWNLRNWESSDSDDE